MVLPSGAKILEGVRRISGRDIVRVQLPGGNFIQPFYRSSGQNSGMGGQWLPFDGLLALSGTEGDHWFHKSRFTSGAANSESHPLHRYGTQLLKDISRELGQIPELALVEGQESKAAEINSWIGTQVADNFNRVSQGKSAVPGLPPGAPVASGGSPPPPSPPAGGGGVGVGVPYQNGPRIQRRAAATPPASGGGGGGDSSSSTSRQPIIHTVRPLRSAVGAHIRLAGARLDQVSEVSIGGIPASIFSIDRALIIVTVPGNATLGTAIIEARYAGGVIAAPGTFTVVASEEDSPEADSSPGGAGEPGRSPHTSGRGRGFWGTLLTDPDVRGAVNRVVPSSARGFINPLMDRGASLLSGSEPMMSAQMGQMMGLAGGAAGGFAAGRAAGTSGILSGAGGLIGGMVGGPIGSAIGAAIGTVVEKAVQTIVNNVRAMHDLGASSVDNLTRGALSLTGRVMEVGGQIGNTLLQAALRPFGASGSALANFAGTLGHSLQGVLGAGLDLAARGLRTAGGLVAGGAGALLTYGGVMAGAMTGGVVGALIGGLIASGIGKAAMGVVNSVTGLIGGVFDHLGRVLGELGRVGGAALQTLLSVLDDVRNAAMGLSKSILDLSQQSGLSVSASAAAVNNLQGFGISPQQTAQMFGQNVLYTQAQDRGWGIAGTPGSVENLRSFRSEYQRLLDMGHGNPLLANTMAQQTGKGALIPMANLSDTAFNRSIGNGQGLQMGEGAVREWQQNFGLLQNDLGRFADYVKITLANAFLPAMQRGLGLAVDFFKNNKEQIIDGIKAVGKWFYVSLPVLMLDGAIAVVNGFNTIVGSLARIIKSLYDSRGAVHHWVEGFLSGIDKMVYGFRTLIAWATGAARAMNPAVMPWDKARVARAGYLDSMLQTFPWQTQLENQFKRATRPQYNAQGQRIPNAGERAVATLRDQYQRGRGTLRSLQRMRDNYDAQGRSDDYDRMFDTLQKIEQNTGRKPDINAKIDVSISPVEDFYAKVMSYETWNTWQALGAAGA